MPPAHAVDDEEQAVVFGSGLVSRAKVCRQLRKEKHRPMSEDQREGRIQPDLLEVQVPQHRTRLPVRGRCLNRTRVAMKGCEMSRRRVMPLI